MNRDSRSTLFACAAVVTSWCVAQSTPVVLSASSSCILHSATIPYVLAGGQPTDMRSSPLHLSIVVGMAVLAGVLAEPAKWSHGRGVAALVLLFQVTLGIEALRAFGFEWFEVVRQGLYLEQLQWRPAPSRSPVLWVSGALCLTVVAAVRRVDARHRV